MTVWSTVVTLAMTVVVVLIMNSLFNQSVHGNPASNGDQPSSSSTECHKPEEEDFQIYLSKIKNLCLDKKYIEKRKADYRIGPNEPLNCPNTCPMRYCLNQFIPMASKCETNKQTGQLDCYCVAETQPLDQPKRLGQQTNIHYIHYSKAWKIVYDREKLAKPSIPIVKSMNKFNYDCKEVLAEVGMSQTESHVIRKANDPPNTPLYISPETLKMR